MPFAAESVRRRLGFASARSRALRRWRGLWLLLCLSSVACDKAKRGEHDSADDASSDETEDGSEADTGPAEPIGRGDSGAGRDGGKPGAADAGRPASAASDADAGSQPRSLDAGNGDAAQRDAGGVDARAQSDDAGSGTITGTEIFFDDFLGTSIDSEKWTVFDRISDQANGEINCCVPANVSVSGGILRGVSKYEDYTCGDSQQAPVTEHYTSWQIQQKTAPILYGVIEVRAKPPAGTGVWPVIWMLGYQWQASQPATANIPGHDWPHAGWCEIDIAEFWQGARTTVNCTVHFNTPGGLHEQDLPFDATSRYMIYRLTWSKDSLIWSVDAEDGKGFRMLRTVTGAGNVPDVPMYVVINASIGGTGGGTANPATFPLTFNVDWVRVSR